MNRTGTGIVLSIAAWLGLALQLALSVRSSYRSGTPSLAALAREAGRPREGPCGAVSS